MFDFVKMMFDAGCQIDGYVGYGAITAADYKSITGKDYVAPSATL
ncbi:XkdX family protein [Lactiplantibacillus plantarum]|nr:XkdX family protein [Lactiplantibacillus plantarum]WND31732.1 XkdX family protein [Lactiplantibacillus plantarum]